MTSATEHPQLPKALTLTIGTIVEERPGVTRWQPKVSVAHSIFLAGEQFESKPKLIYQEGNRRRYFAGLTPLLLHRKETSDYMTNLTSAEPKVFVGLREAVDAEDLAWRPFFASVAPYEAEGYMHGGEEQIDAVAMPGELRLAIQEFIDAHHKNEPFKKRQRTKYFDPDFTPFARPPGWKATDR